ncbi:hypothetical protein OCU04_009834 [Sclerotinia nivalis]|uniref:Uncharacterized protein n=1 Tax=Sclerotinia nivalis TaxID=352851 RepID=A0A9X0AFU2_9HELO|nr:hypothetical protein OCU04_009834 [Sclerotinia nivalis]
MGSNCSSEKNRMSEAIAIKLEELGNLYCDAGDTEVGLSLKELAHSPDRAGSLRSALLEDTSLHRVKKHLKNSVEDPLHDPSQQLLESIISTNNQRLSNHQIHKILDISRQWDRNLQEISQVKMMVSKWLTEPSSFYGLLICQHKSSQIDLLKLCIEQYEQIEDEQKVNPIRRRVILTTIYETVEKEEQRLRRESKVKKRTTSTANYAQPFRSQAIDALAHRLWDSQKVSPKDFSQRKKRLLRMARFGEKWSFIRPAGLLLGLGGSSQSFEHKKWSVFEIQAINELLCTFKIYSLLPTLEAAFQAIKAQYSNGITTTGTEHKTVLLSLPDPHLSISSPNSIDALLNAADYIAGSTQSQQLPTAGNSSIQITNGAVLNSYEQDSIVGEHAEFGSNRGVKRGLESQTEACDPSSKQRRINSFSDLDSSLSQSTKEITQNQGGAIVNLTLGSANTSTIVQAEGVERHTIDSSIGATNKQREIELVFTNPQKEKLNNNLQEPFRSLVMAKYQSGLGDYQQCIVAMFPRDWKQDVTFSITVDRKAGFEMIQMFDLQWSPQVQSVRSQVWQYSDVPIENLHLLGDSFYQAVIRTRKYQSALGHRCACVYAFTSSTDDDDITFSIMVDRDSGQKLRDMFGLQPMEISL